MYVDAQLRFSNAQAVTAAAISDNIVDLGAVRDVGVGEDLYVVVTVGVAFTDGSSDSTLTVDLYGDSTSTITPDAQQRLFIIPALAAIGDTFIAPIAPGYAGNQRYLALYYTPNNGNLTTGTVTAFITKDVSAYRAYAKNYTITG